MKKMNQEEIMDLENELNCCVGHMKNHIKNKIPETGYFKKRGIVYFDIPGTENRCIFIIEDISGERDLQLGVYRSGTDRLYSHYLISGTNQDLLNYLDNENLIEKWRDSVIDLSESVDDYWD